jgi:hypothetical protein
MGPMLLIVNAQILSIHPISSIQQSMVVDIMQAIVSPK